MKLTKFPQSSVLVEAKGTKILVDPSTKEQIKSYLESQNINYIIPDILDTFKI